MTGGNREPEKANYVALCRSADQGATWSEPETVLRLEHRACLLSEVIVHRGRITVFVETHLDRFEDWKVFTISSSDSGTSWSAPVPFRAAPRRAFIRNLCISSWGDWLLPLQSYDTVADPTISPLADKSVDRAEVGALVSADEGATWEVSELVGALQGWAEPNIVELSGGRLVMLVRADRTGCIYRTESADRGRSWSNLEPTDIPNPGSKFRLHRLRDGRIILIHNPSARWDSKKYGSSRRNPLAMWISGDDLRTWGYQRILTEFPGALQYPDGFVDETEEYVHFAFDYNRHDLIYWAAKIPPA